MHNSEGKVTEQLWKSDGQSDGTEMEKVMDKVMEK